MFRSRTTEVVKGDTWMHHSDTSNIRAKSLKSGKLEARPGGRMKAESPVREQRIRERQGGGLVVWVEETHKKKTQL